MQEASSSNSSTLPVAVEVGPTVRPATAIRPVTLLEVGRKRPKQGRCLGVTRQLCLHLEHRRYAGYKRYWCLVQPGVSLAQAQTRTNSRVQMHVSMIIVR